ncbi:MAG TPA: hypothetical protein VM865_07295 [Acidobacteriaceae bacterium]|jgi:hypothetical protein|nr:hypothetical protein [Acidobacteriaceae bacterium]
MLERLRKLSRASHPPVLSLAVCAENAPPRKPQSQFEELVRHLLHRFFHNELLASDDETRRVMQISYSVALLTLLVALFLFPSYHAFPPFPFPRPFWLQVGDHYFFVTYSFVLMGIATVYEWDLLFPDLLDVFVLSILPIASRRLFLARITALGIFLGLVLLGTSVLGVAFFPLVAELPHPLRHLLAHAVAVCSSGAFATASVLALQGILLNVLGERLFRTLGPIVQSLSLSLLLTLLLLVPALSHNIEPILTSGSSLAKLLPTFWFLAIYECLLSGHNALPLFRSLAATGCWSLAFLCACVALTYPLAYRRRVRQLIEGSGASASPSPASATLRRLVNACIVRCPAQRAIFHFISQSILRAQRQRVMLAMCAGFTLSLVIANMLVLHVAHHRVHPTLLPAGIRAAIPITAFWSVVGLRSAMAAPLDRRGAWLFRSTLGQPKPVHFAGTRRWLTLWSTLLTSTAAIALYLLSPASLRTPRVLLAHLILSAGLSSILADLFLWTTSTLPFTSVRRSSITDFPLIIFKYVVLFPILVAAVVGLDRWMSFSTGHLLRAAVFLAATHIVLSRVHSRVSATSTDHTFTYDADDLPGSLGLRDG